MKWGKPNVFAISETYYTVFDFLGCMIFGSCAFTFLFLTFGEKMFS